jgi:uncharacterized protein (DUF983 family)
MIKKGNKLYSILFQKCPRCHEGELFSAKPYQLDRFIKMPDRCSTCGQHYVLEPSFYTGAMYVSHALQVALLTTVYVTLRVLWNPSDNIYIAAIIGSAVLLFPLTLRLSRSIYINFFVKYRHDHERREVA